MNELTVNILTLCDEMLLAIFNKLNNIDVLYSLIGVNQRLDKLAADKIFTRSIDLVAISSNEDNDSRTNSIFDRFYFDIIPRIQHNIECLTLDSLSIDRVLHIGNYPKLHKLTFANLQLEMAFRVFNDESSSIHSFKHQISHLDVTINDDVTFEQIRNMATNIFTTIFIIFTNLTHLEFKSEDNFVYVPSSLIALPSTTCYSSNIVHLNVRVRNFDDFLWLLDGRLSQLHTFIVIVDDMYHSSMTFDNKRTLSNLKCFSFSCRRTGSYDTQIVPLIHAMLQLEKLTLSLTARKRTSFIDGDQLYNEILCKMSHLNTFIFDIVTEFVTIDIELLPTVDSVRHPLIESGYHIGCYIDYCIGAGRCHIYSLPFTLKYMHSVTNNFPGGLFMSVCRLYVQDIFRSFEHDFFARISRAFPLLNTLAIFNFTGQHKKLTHEQTSSIIVYSQLVTLNLGGAHIDYVKQFLFESNTRLLCLKILHVKYKDLIIATDNFTSDAARANCANLKYIIFDDDIPVVYPANFFDYFPSL